MKPKIGVIVGSNRPTRLGRKIADWFMDEVKDNTELDFEIIDLAEVNLPFLSEPQLPAMGNYQQESTKKFSELIASFDGFVFVVAEYNHGYTAVLKNAIDTLYAEWQKKPAAFVGYGVLGASRAIEQLVTVVSQIGMMPLQQTAINIIDSWKIFDDKGVFNKDSRRGAKTDKFIDNLAWWTKTLKTARNS
jgi:NAD(P)H-dependent FMN reductase